MPYSLRPAIPDDAGPASAVVRSAFDADVSKNWTEAACERFRAESDAKALREAIAAAPCALLACRRDEAIGFLLMRTAAKLDMLFVRPEHQRRGVGRMLWECARRTVEAGSPATGTIELNSTPNSIEFYRAIGFWPISGLFEVEGARATRMACWLRARSLGAERMPEDARLKPIKAS